MILWHYQIRPKSGLESGAWIDGYDYQNKDKKKNITITKNKICYFFRAVYHSKNYVIPNHCYC